MGPYGPAGAFGAGGFYGFGFPYGAGFPGYPGYGYPGYGSDRAEGRDDDGGDSSGSVKVYVANLPEDITKDHIEYVFKTYGRVKDVHLMSGKLKHKDGRGACFVTYSHPSEAK